MYMGVVLYRFLYLALDGLERLFYNTHLHFNN